MSVVIKSNNIATKSFGQLKMLGTNAQLEFDRYKARVLSDGGLVRDEARTLNAFRLLFSSGMFGSMNTFVSGTFGVKTDGNQGITRLYAIDGFDMIGVKFGSGTLPKLAADKSIDFTGNAGKGAGNGGLFSTERQIILSKVDSWGWGVKIKSGSGATEKIAGISKHNDEPNSNINVYIELDSGGTMSFVSRRDLSNVDGGGVTADTIGGSTIYNINPTVIVLDKQDEPYRVLMRENSEASSTSSATAKTFKQASSTPFYLDFGGVTSSTSKTFFTRSAFDFISFSNATVQQAKALSFLAL